MHRIHTRVFGCILLALVPGLLLACAGSNSKAIAPALVSGQAMPDSPASAVLDRTPDLPVLDKDSDLADYLAYAALNNPGLQAAFARWKAALDRVPQVSALPDPRFTYAYYIQNVETRVGPQRHGFVVNQTFPWLGVLKLRGDKAARAAQAEEAFYTAAKLKLFYQVQEAYYEYAYVARAIAVSQENLDLLSLFENIARTKYAAGTTPQSSVTRLQVELGKIEDQLRALKDVRAPIVARLNAALNRPGHADLPLPKEVPYEPVVYSEDELVQWLREENPELRALAHETAEAEVGVALARKQYFPDLTLGVQWIETGDAINPAMEDSGKDPVIASVTMNLPIWYGKLRAGEREASSRYLSKKQSRADRENRLLADMRFALYRFEDADRKIDLYGASLIPKARQSLEVALEEFQAGTGGILDIIDAQRTLLRFELDLARARSDRAGRLAELEMLVGERIPGPEGPRGVPQDVPAQDPS